MGKIVADQYSSSISSPGRNEIFRRSPAQRHFLDGVLEVEEAGIDGVPGAWDARELEERLYSVQLFARVLSYSDIWIEATPSLVVISIRSDDIMSSL